MDAVFPEGIGTYTAGDPLGQPVLMQVLHARILAASAPQWPEPKRNAWAAAIEAKREAYDAAVKAYRPVEAAVVVAEAGYRAAVRNGHARLKNFKRDLKSFGLTEAQIHEIIPDAGAGKSRSTSGGDANHDPSCARSTSRDPAGQGRPSARGSAKTASTGPRRAEGKLGPAGTRLGAVRGFRFCAGKGRRTKTAPFFRRRSIGGRFDLSGSARGGSRGPWRSLHPGRGARDMSF
jgi:hypothetical protein